MCMLGAHSMSTRAGSFQVTEKHAKAAALGNALAVSMATPWLLCFLLYSGVGF